MAEVARLDFQTDPLYHKLLFVSRNGTEALATRQKCDGGIRVAKSERFVLGPWKDERPKVELVNLLRSRPSS
jgi:hypothetical protein